MKTFFHILCAILFSGFLIVVGNRYSHTMSKSETDFETEDNTIEIRIMCEQDLWLDTEGIDTSDSLLCDLVDMCNAATAIRSIFTDFDLYMRLEDFKSETRNAILSFDLSIINNNETRSYLEEYRQKMIGLYDVRPNEVDQESINPYLYRNEADEYIADKYSLTHYYNIDIDELTEKFQTEYGVCTTQPLDERCVNAIDLAHANKTEHNDDGSYLENMFELLTCGQYSKYLYSVWLHWRCICQLRNGSSKDSYIPNWIYNKVRNQCLCTILTHIAQNPDDLMAVNQLMQLASANNIYRLGTYEYGNQNALDYYELFHVKYESEDSEE